MTMKSCGFVLSGAKLQKVCKKIRVILGIFMRKSIFILGFLSVFYHHSWGMNSRGNHHGGINGGNEQSLVEKWVSAAQDIKKAYDVYKRNNKLASKDVQNDLEVLVEYYNSIVNNMRKNSVTAHHFKNQESIKAIKQLQSRHDNILMEIKSALSKSGGAGRLDHVQAHSGQLARTVESKPRAPGMTDGAYKAHAAAILKLARDRALKRVTQAEQSGVRGKPDAGMAHSASQSHRFLSQGASIDQNFHYNVGSQLHVPVQPTPQDLYQNREQTDFDAQSLRSPNDNVSNRGSNFALSPRSTNHQSFPQILYGKQGQQPILRENPLEEEKMKTSVPNRTGFVSLPQGVRNPLPAPLRKRKQEVDSVQNIAGTQNVLQEGAGKGEAIRHHGLSSNQSHNVHNMSEGTNNLLVGRQGTRFSPNLGGDSSNHEKSKIEVNLIKNSGQPAQTLKSWTVNEKKELNSFLIKNKISALLLYTELIFGNQNLSETQKQQVEKILNDSFLKVDQKKALKKLFIEGDDRAIRVQLGGLSPKNIQAQDQASSAHRAEPINADNIANRSEDLGSQVSQNNFISGDWLLGQQQRRESQDHVGAFADFLSSELLESGHPRRSVASPFRLQEDPTLNVALALAHSRSHKSVRSKSSQRYADQAVDENEKGILEDKKSSVNYSSDQQSPEKTQGVFSGGYQQPSDRISVDNAQPKIDSDGVVRVSSGQEPMVVGMVRGDFNVDDNIAQQNSVLAGSSLGSQQILRPKSAANHAHAIDGLRGGNADQGSGGQDFGGPSSTSRLAEQIRDTQSQPRTQNPEARRTQEDFSAAPYVHQRDQSISGLNSQELVNDSMQPAPIIGLGTQGVQRFLAQSLEPPYHHPVQGFKQYATDMVAVPQSDLYAKQNEDEQTPTARVEGRFDQQDDERNGSEMRSVQLEMVRPDMGAGIHWRHAAEEEDSVVTDQDNSRVLFSQNSDAIYVNQREPFIPELNSEALVDGRMQPAPRMFSQDNGGSQVFSSNNLEQSSSGKRLEGHVKHTLLTEDDGSAVRLQSGTLSPKNIQEDDRTRSAHRAEPINADNVTSHSEGLAHQASQNNVAILDNRLSAKRQSLDHKPVTALDQLGLRHNDGEGDNYIVRDLLPLNVLSSQLILGQQQVGNPLNSENHLSDGESQDFVRSIHNQGSYGQDFSNHRDTGMQVWQPRSVAFQSATFPATQAMAVQDQRLISSTVIGNDGEEHRNKIQQRLGIFDNSLSNSQQQLGNAPGSLSNSIKSNKLRAVISEDEGNDWNEFYKQNFIPNSSEALQMNYGMLNYCVEQNNQFADLATNVLDHWGRYDDIGKEVNTQKQNQDSILRNISLIKGMLRHGDLSLDDKKHLEDQLWQYREDYRSALPVVERLNMQAKEEFNTLNQDWMTLFDQMRQGGYNVYCEENTVEEENKSNVASQDQEIDLRASYSQSVENLRSASDWITEEELNNLLNRGIFTDDVREIFGNLYSHRMNFEMLESRNISLSKCSKNCLDNVRKKDLLLQKKNESSLSQDEATELASITELCVQEDRLFNELEQKIATLEATIKQGYGIISGQMTSLIQKLDQKGIPWRRLEQPGASRMLMLIPEASVEYSVNSNMQQAALRVSQGDNLAFSEADPIVFDVELLQWCVGQRNMFAEDAKQILDNFNYCKQLQDRNNLLSEKVDSLDEEIENIKHAGREEPDGDPKPEDLIQQKKKWEDEWGRVDSELEHLAGLRSNMVDGLFDKMREQGWNMVWESGEDEAQVEDVVSAANIEDTIEDNSLSTVSHNHQEALLSQQQPVHRSSGLDQ